MELKVFFLLLDTPGSFAQSLTDMVQAGLDEIIPIDAPAHKAGNFQKILVTLNRILFLYGSNGVYFCHG